MTLIERVKEAVEIIGHDDWVFDPDNVGKPFDYCWQIRTEFSGTPVYVVCADRYAKGPGSNDAIARAVAEFPHMARALLAADTLAMAARNVLNHRDSKSFEAFRLALTAYRKATGEHE